MPKVGWKARGRCNDGPYDDVLYEPQSGLPMSRRQVREARRMCSECQVPRDCLAFALLQRDFWGVWGGYTGAERRRMLDLALERILAKTPGAEPTQAELVEMVIIIYDTEDMAGLVIRL